MTPILIDTNGRTSYSIYPYETKEEAMEKGGSIYIDRPSNNIHLPNRAITKAQLQTMKELMAYGDI